MKNNRDAKKRNRLLPTFFMVVMALTTTCAFAQSGGSNLLYSGRYTETDHVWPAGNSMYAFFPIRQIEIYEDKIEVYSILGDGTIDYDKSISPIPFKSMQNGKRIYRTSGLFINITLTVDGNFNISCSDSSGASYRFIKDGSSSTIPQGSYNGGSYNGGGGTGTYTGGNSGNGGNKNTGTTPQPKRHKCGLCGGSGRVATTDGVTSFGKTKYCSECGKTVPDNHYHTTCPSCKGKGWW